ncbi:hypothetical protein O1157_11350 [Streptomyces albogriseolus]
MPVAVQPVGEPDEASAAPRNEFPAVAGVADLAYKLERALERIKELEERVERLEGRDTN